MSHQDKASLTPKQARFVAEYLIDLNAAAAAERAGYSAKVAKQQGYENLRKPSIAAAIAAGHARKLADAGLSAARVLEVLGRVAFSDIGVFWRDDGTVKRPDELTPADRSCLAGFEVVIKNVAAGDGQQDTIYKFRLCDKIRALELLGKHFGLFVEKIELKDVTAEARVARLMAARRRVGDQVA